MNAVSARSRSAAGKTSVRGRQPTVATGLAKPERIANQALSSPGKPMDGATRAKMEAHFSCSFGDVRIHADETAAASARALGAAAFVTGRSIVFDTNRYAPASHAGQLLLAHELAHIRHQSGAKGLRAGTAPANSVAEHHADRAARAAVIGSTAARQSPTTNDWGDAWAIHRQVDKVSTKGKVEHTGEIGRAPNEVGVPFGTVEVRTGEEIEMKGGGKIPNVIALAYDGVFSADTHWLQFVWWELIAITPKGNVAISATIPTTSGTKTSTTDPSAPKVSVDSASSSDPFYEAVGANIRDKSSITMFDRPGGDTVKPLAEAVFKASPDATGVLFRQHFTTFLVQTGAAAYEVGYTASTAFAKNAKGEAIGGTIGYSVGASGQVKGLPADMKAVLDAAYPKNTIK